MNEIDDRNDLAACCAGDTLCLWAAQGLTRGRAFASEDRRAVAVAAPALSGRDRLAVWGTPDAAVPLVVQVLAEVGPTFRPIGDSTLIDALVHGIPALMHRGTFGWMDRRAPDPLRADCRPQDPGKSEWLAPTELPGVDALLDAAFPKAYARPGTPGVQRWAGIHDDTGALAAVGALAWSAPEVGLLSGIAVRPEARGTGLGRQVCAFLLAEALGLYGTAALMVDGWNHTARRLYEGLGMRHHAVSGAAVRP